jgi:tetratricopeptide (TPR) repeat protein
MKLAGLVTLIAVLAAAQAAATPVSQESNAAALVAEGDALVQSRRPGEAIGVYRNAIRSGGGQDVINPKIAAAQVHRHSLLDVCETEEGAAAERACEAAWLPGAPDEVRVFKRRGLLLQNDNQPGASLDAYLTAARLAPRDRDVARAVAALSGSTEHPDAAILTARGAALMTLGRPADAILALREALRLAPDSADAKVRLRKAEGARATQRRNSAAAAALPVTARESGGQADGAFSNDAPVTRSN